MFLLYVGVRDSIRKAQRREIESVPRVQIRAAVKGGVALPSLSPSPPSCSSLIVLLALFFHLSDNYRNSEVGHRLQAEISC